MTPAERARALARFKPCDRVIVFDPILWKGRDCDCCPDNGCFRKPATVHAVYTYDGDPVADVVFDHRGLSKSHFLSGITALPESKAAAIARCDAEIARIEQDGATDEYPAWLIALAKFDWEAEKRAIEREEGK